MKVTNTSALGTLAEIINKENRNEKSTDVLMRTGVKLIKTGPNQGKMMGLLQGVSDHGPKILRNILMGRAPATKDDIKNVLETEGMPTDDINTILANIKSDTKGRFTVKSLNDARYELSKNKPNARTEGDGKVLVGERDTLAADYGYRESLQKTITDYSSDKRPQIDKYGYPEL